MAPPSHYALWIILQYGGMVYDTMVLLYRTVLLVCEHAIGSYACHHLLQCVCLLRLGKRRQGKHTCGCAGTATGAASCQQARGRTLIVHVRGTTSCTALTCLRLSLAGLDQDKEIASNVPCKLERKWLPVIRHVPCIVAMVHSIDRSSLR